MTPGSRSGLSGARYGQQLRGVCFARMDLVAVSTPALLRLERCSLAGADLRQATLDGMQLRMCTLQGADLRGASLRGADLRGASFTAVNTGDESGRSVLGGALLDDGALEQAEAEPGTLLP